MLLGRCETALVALKLLIVVVTVGAMKVNLAADDAPLVLKIALVDAHVAVLMMLIRFEAERPTQLIPALVAQYLRGIAVYEVAVSLDSSVEACGSLAFRPGFLPIGSCLRRQDI